MNGKFHTILAVILTLLSACRTSPNKWNAVMVETGSTGIRLSAEGRFDSARLYLEKALEMPGGREYEGGRFIANLANSYGFEGRYAEALKYYMESLQVGERLATEETGEAHRIAQLNIVRTAANLAEIHYLTGNHKQALYYAERAREIGLVLGTSYITPQYLYIIGSVRLDDGELDKAEQTMRETYVVADTICRHHLRSAGDALGMYMYVAYGAEGLARVALARGDHSDAMDYAETALEYAGLHEDPLVAAKVLATLSDINMSQGDHEEAGRYALRAIETSPDYPKLNPGVVFNLAASQLFAGDRAGAYENFRRYSSLMKENTDRQFRETMAGMEVVYETEKKEARISALEQQRILYVAIGLAGLLLACTVWIIFRQKIRGERKEKQLAAANTILEWEKKERKRFASDLHDGINGMLSALKLELGTSEEALLAVRNGLDDCIGTIRRMSRGMMPGSLERYGLKSALEDYCRLFPNVDFHFLGTERRLDEKLELALYYCAYELINNSFRHSGAQSIDVELVQDETSVSLMVEDDGRGFDCTRADKNPGAREGSGLKNIASRLAAFGGIMDTCSSPGNGTETNIQISL